MCLKCVETWIWHGLHVEAEVLAEAPRPVELQEKKRGSGDSCPGATWKPGVSRATGGT